MPDKIITVPFGPSELATVNFDGLDTTYRLELREIILNGVQGTDVGKSFTLHFQDGSGGTGSTVTESFQQVRPTGRAVGPNIGEKSATGSKDIPIFIDNSPLVHIEYNYPHVLINQPVPSTKYTFTPNLVLSSDGQTQPIFSSCVLKFCLSYGPNNQYSNYWPTIKYAFRNG